MTDVQEQVTRLSDALEQRGARNVAVQGDLELNGFSSTNDRPQPSIEYEGTMEAEYDGPPEVVRNAVAEMGRLMLLDVACQAWPNGDVRVTADIRVLPAGSGGTHPGGNTDSSPSSTVPQPTEAEQDPHVRPGGTWAIEDEAGVADECAVECWPVRMWEPAPQVPAVSMLRYAPAPRAHGLEWWGGYVHLAADGWQPSGGRAQQALRVLRHRLPEYEGVEVPVSYYDEHGWVGWSACDLPVEVSGIPVYSSAGTEVAAMDHHEAGDVTAALAEAALKVRHEVLR